MALLNVSFFSHVLGMCMQMDVILPQRAPGKPSVSKYPTLYLLHGMSDDHTRWRRQTSIERYVEDMNLAVVMPTTHLGWYTDMYRGLNYWTYISEELPAVCREFFPAMSDKREDTFAAGLSMGGYGAIKLGLRASGTFSKAASLSGAMDMADLPKDPPPGRAFWENIFGPIEDIKGSFNDLLAAATDLKQSGKPLTDIYMWCGTEDFLYEANVKMRDHLTALGFPFIYEDAPGDHQWKYWDEKIQTVLKWLNIDKSE